MILSFRDGDMINRKKMKGREYPEPDYCILDLINSHLQVQCVHDFFYFCRPRLPAGFIRHLRCVNLLIKINSSKATKDIS